MFHVKHFKSDGGGIGIAAETEPESTKFERMDSLEMGGFGFLSEEFPTAIDSRSVGARIL